MISFRPGETAYVLVHNNRVEEVRVLRKCGDRYCLRAADGTGMFLASSRLFRSREEAAGSIKRTPPANARPDPHGGTVRMRQYEGNMYIGE